MSLLVTMKNSQTEWDNWADSPASKRKIKLLLIHFGKKDIYLVYDYFKGKRLH